MDNRLSEALQILGVSRVEQVTPVYVNQLVASRPNQESWIKYAFHYVKMIAGDSLPKDTEVFKEKEDQDYQFDQDDEIDDLFNLDYEEEISKQEIPENPSENFLSAIFEPYLPDRYSTWSLRRRNLENLINYLPTDTEVADDFEMLARYYALEIYRKSLVAYNAHEFSYDFFEESVLEMSNFVKLEIKILQELKFIGIDDDEGGFGLKFNKYIREFTEVMRDKKD